MEGLRPTLRDRLLPIGLNQALGFLCGILGVRVATGLVKPAEYGAYGLFMSFTPLGIWVVHAGLQRGLSRHWVESGDRRGLLRHCLRLGLRGIPWLLLGSLVAVLAFGFHPALLHLLLLTLGTVFFSCFGVLQTALQAERAHWADLQGGLAASLTRTFLPLLLYAFLAPSLLSLELGFALHAVLTSLVLWLLVSARLPRVAAASRSELPPSYQGLQFPLLGLTAWVALSANRWLVELCFGGELTGYFVLASNISLVVTGALSVLVVQGFQPQLFAMPLRNRAEARVLLGRVDLLSLAYLVLAGLGLLGLRLLLPSLVGVWVHERYRDAISWVLPAGLFGIALALQQFQQMLLLAARRERFCRILDPLGAGVLCFAAAVAAFFGTAPFRLCLCLAPLVPLLVLRTLARRHILSTTRSLD
jgi:hypothetical protein